MMMTMDNSRRVLNIAALFDFISGVLLTALGICGFALAFTALNTPDLAYKMSSFGGSSVIICTWGWASARFHTCLLP